MAELFTFFNSKNGDRKYNASHWADYFKPLFKSGVFNGDLEVTANGNMSVTLGAGYAWIEGYGYHNTEPLVIDLEVASGNLNRIDAIKIRLNLTERTIHGIATTGGNAATPAAPTNERSETVFELTVAEVNIPAGTTVITQSMITDTRMDNSKCGWVAGAVEQIDFSQIYAQFTQYFAEKRAVIEHDVQDFEEDIDKKKQDAANYLQKYKDGVDDNKSSADAFLEEFKLYLQNYTTQQQQTFEAWILTIQGILTEEAAGNLLLMIENLQGRVGTLEDFINNRQAIVELATSDGFGIVTDTGDVIGTWFTFETK